MLVILGIIILFVLPLILFYGHYHFYDTVEKEVNTLFNTYGKEESFVTPNDLENLPKELQDYLIKVGVLNTCKDCNVTLTQTGRIKTAQDKNWMNFTATQYMTVNPIGFIWRAKAFPMFIRDKSYNGIGEVKVSLLGLIDVAKTSDKKTAESALARSLGELLFYPIGFLNNTISWDVLPGGSLKASITLNETKAEGIFSFNKEGLLFKFQSKRYMGDKLESFTGIAEDYKTMNGLRIPTKMRAIWNLEGGDFEYYNATITACIID